MDSLNYKIIDGIYKNEDEFLDLATRTYAMIWHAKLILFHLEASYGGALQKSQASAKNLVCLKRLSSKI